MISVHSLPEEAFIALANGEGDSTAIRRLRAAQHSKHLMLLHAVAESVGSADPASRATAAFWAGHRLLARIQTGSPGAVAWLLGLPQVGSWAHDCLTRLDRGLPPDLGYLARAAAAAGLRSRIPFELDAPVQDGRLLLPGLGALQVADDDGWVRLLCDGEHLVAGEGGSVPCAALTPDDGSGGRLPEWQGTPLVRAVADGHTWDVLLETADQHLDRYGLPMRTAMTAEEVADWRHRIQSAWTLLVTHHAWAAHPLAEAVPVIVPLTQRTSLDSATSPAAFGAIATSWPSSPVIMAETLVHEFQHLKLCGLLDMVPLMNTCEEKTYAPWRDDPRPASGLLQGVYAHLGIVLYWEAQRRAETGPDSTLRAQVNYERWRRTIEPATSTLLQTGSLTPAGVTFVTTLRQRGRRLESEPVPVAAREIAGETALDHWLTWQFSHTTVDAAAVASLAAAYQRGEATGGRALPDDRIEDDVREIDPVVRSRALRMRYLEPQRYGRLRAEGMPGLGAADSLLACGEADSAVRAYQTEIAESGSCPEAWTGLALAIYRLPESPLRQVFATRLPLLFEIHSYLYEQGIRSDPLDLAAWVR